MRVFQNLLESEAKTIFHMLRKQTGQKGDLVLVSVLKFSIHHPHYSLSSTVQVESTKKSETIVILLIFLPQLFLPEPMVCRPDPSFGETFYDVNVMKCLKDQSL